MPFTPSNHFLFYLGFSPSSEHAFSDTYVESKRAGRNLVAVILGMSVREAAALGMIDESGLPERMQESPVEDPTPSENTLFVSDKDNTTPAPIVEIPSPSDSDAPVSASLTKSALNPFQQPTPSPFANPPQAAQPTAPPVPPQPPNPFTSMFSGTQASEAAETAPVNPFAAKSTFSPSPSPFAFASPAGGTPKESISPAGIKESTAPSPYPFAFSKPTQAVDKAAAPPTTSPFSFAKPAQATEKFDIPATTSPIAFPKSAETPGKEITPAASPNPFAASISAFTPPKPLEPAEKPAISSTISKSIFPSVGVNGTISPKLFGPTAGPSVFPTSQDQKPLFPAPSPLAKPDDVTGPRPAKEKELFIKPAKPQQDQSVLQTPVEVAAKEPEVAEPALSVSQLDQSTTSSFSSTQTSVDCQTNEWRAPRTDEEELALFKRIMKRAEEEAQRKEEKRKRKRVEEMHALVDSIREERLKVSNLSSPGESPPPAKRFSLAESSIKALPTLPCLERTKALLEKKPTPEPEQEKAKRRQREIDEDEILLNSARIVAEQLRTGPKIFDEMSPQSLAEYNAYHAYWEERGKRRRSYSNSISPAITPFAHSASPPQFPRHPYEVAYAPDTPLGLGRTMSRTEHRIRMTGGHGLAYKPLDFTRSKSRENTKYHDKIMDNGKSRFAMSG